MSMHERRAEYRAVIAVLICSIFGPALPAQSEKEPPVGIVDRVEGPWYLVQTNQLIHRGQMLHQGQTIQIEPSSSASVSILMFASNQMWEQKCSEAAPCKGSYRLTANAVTRDKGSSFWRFFTDYWSADRPLEPTLMGSRSGGHGPSHALLERSPAGVDLKPALGKVTPGEYDVQLIPAPGSTGAGPGWRGVVSIGPGLSPQIPAVPNGLYLMSLTSKAGESVGSAAAVLVIDQKESNLRAAWEEAQAATRAWTTASAVTIDAFLARALYSLDAQRKQP
jgi:hypothetical protein